VSSAALTVVIGAGISGLACAYSLKKSRQKVLLLEAAARPGGAIQSVAEDGFLYELGPQSFSSTDRLTQLSDELGLTPEIVEAPHGAPRYVLLDGKLLPVPLSPPAMLFSDLLSWGTKFSFLRDVFGRTVPPLAEESIAAFVRRKFSAELLDRLVGPFVSGIYAGDPERLSLRAAFPKLYEAEKAGGSVIRGGLQLASDSGRKAARPSKRRPGLLSFRSGNQALVSALAKSLGASLRCNAEIIEIQISQSGFQLRVRTGGDNDEVSCARLVIATPTSAACKLLDGIAPAASTALHKIPYAAVAVVSLGYSTKQVSRSLDGFGFLIPRSTGVRTLGTIWNSSLFPERAPTGHVLLTSFIGGTTDPETASLPAEGLRDLVHREISEILQITGVPMATRVTGYLQAIPQYNLGHLDLLKTIEASVRQIPGLYLIGNYWKGPAVGACVENALSVAEVIRIG
jgi:oxygen-dependent protoporphyrinogen oxidase